MNAGPTTVNEALRAALALQQGGDWPAAEQAWRDLLARFGSQPDAEHMLGLTLHALGRSEEALPWFERAGRQRGGAMLWSNHAAALLALGRAREAASLARRAVKADAKHAGAWLNLGLADEIEGKFGEAASALSNALQAAPGNLAARRALARCQLAMKHADAALLALSSVAVGRDAAIDLVRAEALIMRGDLDAASTLLENLVADDALRTQALNLQAEIALARGHSNAALATLKRVIDIDAGNRHAIIKTALLQIARGEAESGLAAMRDWLDGHPDDNATAGSYLVACNYSERFDPPAMLAEHRRVQPPTLMAPEWPSGYRANTSGQLRIGWVSTAFSVGPMEIFFADVVRAFAKVSPDVQHVLYAIGGESTTAPPSAAWAQNTRDLSRLGTAEILEAIRADGVDVLVDLVGRAAGNRIALFAARAAPMQVGWLDVFYPSGLDTMDFLVTDPWLSPHGADADFSEKLIRLPHGRLAYNAPPVAEPNIEAARLKQFISLNRFSKCGDAVIDVWASILRELPDWTLLLKAQGRDDDLVSHFLEKFRARRVDPSRITIEGGGPYAEAMAAYNRGAIALDPFPFSGCSTSCDALWMGLPVITLPHATIASRQTAAWLELAGRPEWIARDADDYLAKAVSLARDEAGRTAWCATARSILRPAICDSERCARELVDALRAAAGR